MKTLTEDGFFIPHVSQYQLNTSHGDVYHWWTKYLVIAISGKRDKHIIASMCLTSGSCWYADLIEITRPYLIDDSIIDRLIESHVEFMGAKDYNSPDYQLIFNEQFIGHFETNYSNGHTAKIICNPNAQDNPTAFEQYRTALQMQIRKQVTLK